MICDAELDLGLLPPSPTCSLVTKVEKVESEVATMRDELRSQGRRLALVVGAVSAISPHLVAFCEWLWAHRAEGVLSLIW